MKRIIACLLCLVAQAAHGQGFHYSYWPEKMSNGAKQVVIVRTYLNGVEKDPKRGDTSDVWTFDKNGELVSDFDKLAGQMFMSMSGTQRRYVVSKNERGQITARTSYGEDPFKRMMGEQPYDSTLIEYRTSFVYDDAGREILQRFEGGPKLKLIQQVYRTYDSKGREVKMEIMTPEPDYATMMYFADVYETVYVGNTSQSKGFLKGELVSKSFTAYDNKNRVVKTVNLDAKNDTLDVYTAAYDVVTGKTTMEERRYKNIGPYTFTTNDFRNKCGIITALRYYYDNRGRLTEVYRYSNKTLCWIDRLHYQY